MVATLKRIFRRERERERERRDDNNVRGREVPRKKRATPTKGRKEEKAKRIQQPPFHTLESQYVRHKEDFDCRVGPRTGFHREWRESRR